jgi:hypothetical protein
MTDVEMEGEEKKKGRKGPIIALIAVIGAAIAGLMFWRSRKGSSSEDEELEDEI